MNSVSYPSSRVDGTLVQLVDFVSLLPEQGLIWSILYFQGVGTFPHLTMEDLERLAFEGPKGHTWIFVNYLIMLQAWVTLKLEAKPESLAGVELRLKENAFEEAIKTLILDLETEAKQR